MTAEQKNVPKESKKAKSAACWQEEIIKKDKAVREHQSEKQLDETVEDSFPASDPPPRN